MKLPNKFVKPTPKPMCGFGALAVLGAAYDLR